jgi:hypothetical protein
VVLRAIHMGIPKVCTPSPSGVERRTERKDEHETNRPFNTVIRHFYSFLESLVRLRRVGRLHAIGISQLAQFDSYLVPRGVDVIVESDVVLNSSI